MPFDGENFVETKPDVFSLEGLIAWLETQEPATRYDWDNCDGECLIGRYYAAHRIHNIYHRVFDGLPSGSYGTVCMLEPWTYGAALARARALLASRQP